MRYLRIWQMSCAVVVSGLMFASPTQAAYPGHNGGVGFSYIARGSQFDSYGLDSVGTTPHFQLSCSRPSPKPVVCPATDLSAGLQWSPSGRMVAFVMSDDGSGVLAMVNSDDSGVRELRPLTADDTQPTWAPAGDTLAFAGRSGDRANQTDQGRQNIYRVAVDGHGLRRLTGHGGYLPVWSVRQRIAFLRSGNIYVMRTDGSHQQRITNRGSIGRVDWSPDGRRLVYDYSSPSQTVSDLHVIDGDGRHGHLLLRGGARAAFSPDGRDLTFELGFCGNVVTARMDGSHQHLIAQASCGGGADQGSYSPGFPDWQPLPR